MQRTINLRTIRIMPAILSLVVTSCILFAISGAAAHPRRTARCELSAIISDLDLAAPKGREVRDQQDGGMA